MADRKFVSMLAVGVGIVLVAFAVVVILSAASSSSARVLHLLPENTIAVLDVSNVAKLLDGDDGDALLEFYTEILAEEEDWTEEQAKHLTDSLRRVRSVSVSFHGIGTAADDDIPRVLVIADVGTTAPLKELLPEPAMRDLESTGSINGVEVYAIDEDESFLAAAGGDVLWSSDRAVLTDVLDAIENGRDRSLADNEALTRARKGQKARDVQLYVSGPELFSLIERNISDYDRDEFRAARTFFGFGDIECAYYSMDLDCRAAEARLLLDEESETYKVLARPEAAMGIADYLPADALLCYSVNIDDGGQVWQVIGRQGEAACVAEDARRGREKYQEMIAGFRESFGTGVEDIASAIKEIGFLMVGEVDDDNVCVFARLSDRATAEGMVDRAVAAMRRGGMSRFLDTVVEGVHVRGAEWGPCYAVVDDFVFVGEPDAVQRVVAGMSRRGSGGKPKYLSALPGRAGHFFGIATGEVIRAAVGDDFDKAPEEVRDFVDGLYHTASVTASDGMLVFKLNQSKPLPPLVKALREALEEARQQARKAADRASLHQIGLGIAMYKNDMRGQYPPNLKTLLDKGYIDDAEVFVSPGDESPPLVDGLRCGYVYRKPERRANPNTIICYTRPGVFADGSNVLFADLAVVWVAGPGLKNPRTGEGVLP